MHCMQEKITWTQNYEQMISSYVFVWNLDNFFSTLQFNQCLLHLSKLEMHTSWNLEFFLVRNQYQFRKVDLLYITNPVFLNSRQNTIIKIGFLKKVINYLQSTSLSFCGYSFFIGKFPIRKLKKTTKNRHIAKIIY